MNSAPVGYANISAQLCGAYHVGSAALVDLGVQLVGIDYLSVDAFTRQDFPVHRLLLGAGVLILEGLDLRAVPPGDYELLVLPCYCGTVMVPPPAPCYGLRHHGAQHFVQLHRERMSCKMHTS